MNIDAEPVSVRDESPGPAVLGPLHAPGEQPRLFSAFVKPFTFFLNYPHLGRDAEDPQDGQDTHHSSQGPHRHATYTTLHCKEI